MKIFLTGDRSMPAPVATLVVGGLLGQVALTVDEPVELLTGDNAGFEDGVRLLAERLGLSLGVVVTPLTGDGARDWDARNTTANGLADRVIFVHTDPLASSIGKSLINIVSDENLVLCNPLAAVAF